jgi:hypothetical protein
MMKHTGIAIVMAWSVVLICASCAGTKAGPPSVGKSALPKAIKLVATFDEGLYASKGAQNPFSASGHVSLVDGGSGRGKAAHFGGHDAFSNGKARRPWDKSALIFDGVNIPTDRATIGCKLRFSSKRNWADGKRTWLMVLLPKVGQSLSTTYDNGTALAVFKDKDNTIALGVYQFYKKRIAPTFIRRGKPYEVGEPDAIPLRINVAKRKPGEWVTVRFGWDRKAGKVWLAVGDEIKSAKTVFRPAVPQVLLLGTPPAIAWSSAKGYDGDMDDLIVDGRTLATDKAVCKALPANLAPMATPKNGTVPAVHLKDDKIGAQMESVVRSHLANLMAIQGEHGGWAFSNAWPSRLWFLSTKVVTPHTREYFNNAKDGNSSACAFRLLAGYLTLGDKVYLDAAERTGATVMAIQSKNGSWPYAVEYDAKTKKLTSVYDTSIAPLEDHAQSHTTLLMWTLYDMTKKEEYLAAGNKGRDFILMAQNPNGSWSHHYNFKKGHGESARRFPRAGEINDDTTADQMKVMLLAYRRTGEIKYLASYLRAADWLAAAFIDKKAKGWAQQYDEHNNPIQARHFEPAAIGMSEGTSSAPNGLMKAYRMTGDERYAVPVRKWYKWMMDNRVFTNKEKTKWGWHTYYDPKDGKPFAYAKRKRVPVDSKRVREGGYTSVLRRIAKLDKPEPKRSSAKSRAKAVLRAEEQAKEKANDPVANRLRPMPLVRMFNWEAGSWLFGARGTPTGGFISPSTVRVSLVCWSVFLRRQIAGQIPWDDPRGTLTRSEWASPFYYLLPSQEMYKNLTPEEIQKARAVK